MDVWRLSRRRHAAFDGEGARRYGGRWNPPGTSVVYTSATFSLAALEMFVRLDAEDAADDLVATAAEIPDDLDVTALAVVGLPKGWRSVPYAEEARSLGGVWIAGLATAVLSVPSAVIPQERNYILNTTHPDFARITLATPQPFSFDPRMWKA